MEVFKLGPVLEEKKICVGLYRDVKNSEELKELVGSGRIEGALVRADLLVDTFQVVVAATKAFLLQEQGKMKTRNVFTEVLFQLSPSNKITECFKLFGITASSSDVVLITAAGNESHHSFVDGNVAELSTLFKTCNKARLQDLYRITDDELKVSSLVDCIVSQMAATEFK